MIITTTNSIENAKVEKYLGVVTTNLVIGTNFFSDFKAAFTDFFGGMSGTYRKQMDTLYQKAYDALSLKASSMGANGVLGFKIDFSELSGKGTQMFMISVSGTAVKVAFESASSDDIQRVGKVSTNKLSVELFKERWSTRDNAFFPNREELNFIMENGLWELAPSLYDYYVIPLRFDELRPIDEKFPAILSAMSYNDVVQFIYKDYSSRKKYAYGLIKENYLFNAEQILQLLQDNHISVAIELLETEKAEYDEVDLQAMEDICTFLDSLPDKGRIEEVKGGLLSSKMVEKYICPNGHKNDKECVFCQEYDCGLNIKGITQNEVNIINTFKDKVRILKALLKDN